MPRVARQKSKSGIYHIMLRGSNRQEIFHDDEDYVRFLDTLARYKKESKIDVFGWCIMGNHIHLLLRESKEEEIGITMKRLGISYVSYYNWKYKAIGHLFQDRFKSEKVETDAYLLTVIRYIHQNPVKAGLVEKHHLWEWSSCRGYYGESQYPARLLDDDFILSIFHKEKTKAREIFMEFNEQNNDDKCLEYKEYRVLTDNEVKVELKKLFTHIEITDIKNLNKAERNSILNRAKEIEGVNQQQLARITGISQPIISRA
jgi:putative transposase